MTVTQQASGFTEAYTYTVAAGATVVVPVRLTIFSPKRVSGDAVPTYPTSGLWTLTVPYYDNGVSKSEAFTQSITTTAAASTSAFGYTGADFATYAAVVRPLWGTININVPPPAGSITVTGASVGLNGGAKLEIWTGPNFTSKTQRALELVTNATPGSAVAPVVWTTTVPGSYVNQKYWIFFNGAEITTFPRTSAADGVDITLDGFGSFAYVVDVSAVQDEGFVPELVVDEEGETLPGIGSPVEVNPWATDEAHERPDAVSVNSLGTDPQSDVAAATSVKDMYRANRAAIEDALNPGPIAPFDTAGWAKNNALSTPHAADADKLAQMSAAPVTNLVDQLDAMAGGALAPGLSSSVGGLGASPGIPVHRYDNVLLGTIVPPSWAVYVRICFVVVLSIAFCIAMWVILRGAILSR